MEIFFYLNMLENVLTKKEVLESVNKARENSPLNESYDLKQIVDEESPSRWQELANRLSESIQDYISQEYGVDMKVSPFVTETKNVFECLETRPYFNWFGGRNLWGTTVQNIGKVWCYLEATCSDIIAMPKVMIDNIEDGKEKKSYWGTTKEVHKALNSGGNELINISEIPDYHTFVFTVAREAGHNLAHNKDIDPEYHEKFASNFGMDFTDWYISQYF